jgi:hypothetical protein
MRTTTPLLLALTLVGCADKGFEPEEGFLRISKHETQ